MNINLSVYQATPYNHQQFRPQATMTADKSSAATGGQSFQELLNAQMAASTSVTTYRKR
ncbi:hypothetical protein [Paenibacillus wulumuqiensis]|uniref:hypothetical protein n=1 Tax=Paenibacillus wulumuqiensis TaxID=1567107 RepID=UPI000A740607|nr:hypothetical protein [Paenibacillus wulumuqiensis]